MTSHGEPSGDARQLARHGQVSGLIDAVTYFGDDPALALVTADLAAWVAAHPCECDALCECDE